MLDAKLIEILFNSTSHKYIAVYCTWRYQGSRQVDMHTILQLHTTQHCKDLTNLFMYPLPTLLFLKKMFQDIQLMKKN